ncbi:MAG: hypothetical protein JWL73_134 [Actinomycetia bacterium]|nr:hypothetical protein [Actinomycetes bacterium]
MDTDSIIERLRDIEAELRDLSFDRLRAAAAGDATGESDERAVGKARRAIEKAIRDLSPLRRDDDWD